MSEPQFGAWTPVSERLPGSTNGVPKSDMVMMFAAHNRGIGYYDYRLTEWRRPNGRLVPNVTHWMVQPPPPKREDAADVQCEE